jgi:hypothetical protein
MAFARYTECVEASSYYDLATHRTYGRAYLLLVITIVAMVGFGAYLLQINAAVVAISTAIAAVIGGIIYARWCLFIRLICLDQDPNDCAIIGIVDSTENVDPGFIDGKNGDNDYCINLLLAPGPNADEGLKIDDVDKKDFWDSEPQGHLLAEIPKIKNEAGLGYVQDGGDLMYMKLLHCEFEGDGIRQILDAFYGMLIVLGLALTAAILAYIFPLFYLALIILAWVLFAFALLLGGITFQNVVSHSRPPVIEGGNPLDVDPNNGPITPGWFVVVKGVWVYDSNHQGWNELHPVQDCCIIWKPEPNEDGTFKTFKDFKYIDQNISYDLNSVDNVVRYRNLWCGMFGECKDAQDNGSRSDPKNDWGIHPVVDGCKPPDIIL